MLQNRSLLQTQGKEALKQQQLLIKACQLHVDPSSFRFAHDSDGRANFSPYITVFFSYLKVCLACSPFFKDSYSSPHGCI